MCLTDSCTNVCIEDCNISTGGDALSIKSGWDEYGMAYKWPSSNIWIRNVFSSAPTGAGFAIGSEMSGGVSNIKVAFTISDFVNHSEVSSNVSGLPTVLSSDMKARVSTLFLKMWFSGFIVLFVVTRKAPWLAVH